ncbi:MAG: enoyl-CoA hydratase [Myxococcota bacterium]|nr:enoyl-CoA hydratase [Myxococcota bacterium]
MAEAMCLYEVSDGVATITLNRPEARNALSARLIAELASAFEAAREDADARVVILTGAGDAFCAGLDLRELGGGSGVGEASEWGRPSYSTAMSAFDGPIIGAINGAAITAGFEIALACDLLVASTTARFADTHVRVGVMPGSGLSQRLPRAVGVHRAKYLSLTGNFLPAEQAAEWGLVSHVVEPEVLLETARGIAADMLSAQPHMLAPIKDIIDRGFSVTLGEGLELESETSANQFATEKPQAGAGAAFEEVRERGRRQK